VTKALEPLTNGAEARPALLDLEGLRPGAPGEDAALFLEHLALHALSPWPPARRAAGRAARAFLEGLGARPPLALRRAKALRVAAWSPALAEGRRGALRRHGARLRRLAAESPRAGLDAEPPA